MCYVNHPAHRYAYDDVDNDDNDKYDLDDDVWSSMAVHAVNPQKKRSSKRISLEDLAEKAIS